MNTEPPNSDTQRSAVPYPIQGFWALVVTQFQGAFNDNAFQTLITLYLLNVFHDEMIRRLMIPLAMALFTVPYLLFSIYCGAVADRNGKKRVIIWAKWLEIVIMLCGLAGFLAGRPVVAASVLLATLFLMATQSTLFSPAKYGILPEILPPRRLSWGNGIIQMGTFVAIICGTAVAALAISRLGTSVYLASVALVALSVGGLLMSFGVCNPPPADPTRRIPLWPWAGLGRYMRIFVADRWLLLTMLGIAYFWFLGAMVRQNIMLFGKETLELDSFGIGMLLASVAFGIGTGSVAAGYLSGGKIEVGLIPLGAAGIAAFSVLLAVPHRSFYALLALLLCLGFSGGFYIVPLSATLQQRSPRDVKGGMIATTNFFTFAAMTVSAGVFYLLTTTLKLSPYHVFLVGGLMTVAVSVYICGLLPYFLVRFLVWMVANMMYRVRVDGRENIPEQGGALFVSNHMSFIDGLLLGISTDRQLRFLIFKDYYEKPLVRLFANVARAIPITPGDRPHETAAALDEAGNAIRAGDVVCVFAEGEITRIGQMLPFRRGLERIMRGLDAPIVPINLDRVWGSIFSFSKGRFFWKIPSFFRQKITITYGTPLPPDSSALDVRTAVQELASRAFVHRKPDLPLLHRGFVSTARRNFWRPAIGDTATRPLSYATTLAVAVALARKLKPVLGGTRMVGIVMPQSVGSALCNVALELMGKVPVNLSHSAPVDVLASMARQCDIKKVVTSRALIDERSVDLPAEPVYLEDVFDRFNIADGVVALLLALFCPVRLLERTLGAPAGRSQDDMCTVIFSSGTSGEPKGVMLSHFNVTSNIEGITQLFGVSGRDRVLGILPFSQSFGFTCTLWLPLTLGIGVVFHHNPMDVRRLATLVRRHRVTVLIAAPVHLRHYTEHCSGRDFGSLTYVITGGANLPEEVAVAFEDTFGVRPYEGYGCTECAPVVALNVPDYRAPGFCQVGHKRGRIGHPLPGVSVRIVDPDTFEPVPVGTAGMLLVRGPNVMMGYLNDPVLTDTVIRDGWYITGDIAVLDEDGFLTIVGRRSRVSRIAGELVPHGIVEEKLRRLLDLPERSLAVVGIEDPEEGEQLAVLHTLDNERLDELIDRISESDLPESWRPDPDAFHRIQSMPLLPSGNIDLRRLTQFAEPVQ